jgi:hypothetical protein
VFVVVDVDVDDNDCCGAPPNKLTNKADGPKAAVDALTDIAVAVADTGSPNPLLVRNGDVIGLLALTSDDDDDDNDRVEVVLAELVVDVVVGAVGVGVGVALNAAKLRFASYLPYIAT